MADKHLKKSFGRFRWCNGKPSKQTFQCLICNDEVIPNTGYSILHTLMPHNKGILCDNINRVLQRDIDAVTARSTVLCNRCFALFSDLNTAEERCIEIKNELTRYYTETSHIYKDFKPISVSGVACQTETKLNENFSLKSKHEDKVPNRRRGRPRKSDVSNSNRKSNVESQSDTPVGNKKRDRSEESVELNSAQIEIQAENMDIENENCIATRSSVSDELSEENSEDKSLVTLKADELDIVQNIVKCTNDLNDVQDVVKCADHLNNVQDITKSTTTKRKSKLPKRNPKVSNAQISNDAKACNSTDNEDSGNGSNCNDLIAQHDLVDDDNAFINDYYSCDDDFEWKEEDNNGTSASKSTEKNENSESNSTNDQAKMKKRKHKNRKGERAFMVPIHTCDVCGKKWRTMTELKSHMASHSQIRPYVCEICGQAYKLKKALDVHVGMHNGIHPFVCMYCKKSFTQKVGLEKHLPIHTGISRYQCDLCGRRFIHQKSLNIHNMTHTGVKNVHCPVCNLALFSQSHLKRHYRVHTGEKPYACTVCGKRFAEKYNLNAHLKIHDPNSGVESRRRSHVLSSTRTRLCPICRTSFDTKKKLTEHLRTVHSIWRTTLSNSEDFNTSECAEHESHDQQQLVKEEESDMLVSQSPIVIASSAESDFKSDATNNISAAGLSEKPNNSQYESHTSSPQSCPPALSHNPLEHHFLISQSDFVSTTFAPITTTLAPGHQNVKNPEQNLVSVRSTITAVMSSAEQHLHCQHADGGRAQLQMSSLQPDQSVNHQQECGPTSEESAQHSSLLRTALQNFIIPQSEFAPTFPPSTAVATVPIYDSSEVEAIAPIFQLVTISTNPAATTVSAISASGNDNV